MSDRDRLSVHHCSIATCLFQVFGRARYEIAAQKPAGAKGEIRFRAATGRFGPCYNGVFPIVNSSPSDNGRELVQHHAKRYQPPLALLYGRHPGRCSGYAL